MTSCVLVIKNRVGVIECLSKGGECQQMGAKGCSRVIGISVLRKETESKDRKSQVEANQGCNSSALEGSCNAEWAVK